MARGFALAVAMAAAACAGAGGADRAPASTAVEAYIEAINADDPRAAYELLSERERRRTPYEAFARAWRETPAERRAAAEDLREGLAASTDLDERAAVTLAASDTVYLSREGGKWLLDAPLAAPDRVPTPRDAVTRLADALKAKRYEDLIRILSERRRDAIRERVQKLTRGLDAHRNAPLERLSDDRAALEWNDDSTRYRVILREEDGDWRVDEIHIMGLLEAD